MNIDAKTLQTIFNRAGLNLTEEMAIEIIKLNKGKSFGGLFSKRSNEDEFIHRIKQRISDVYTDSNSIIFGIENDLKELGL